LRERITPKQRALLDATWEIYADSGTPSLPDKWLIQDDAYPSLGADAVDAAVEALGNEIVYLHGRKPGTYQLNIVGMLLTSHYKDLENLLVSFYQFVAKHSRKTEVFFSEYQAAEKKTDQEIGILVRALTRWRPKNLRVNFGPSGF